MSMIEQRTPMAVGGLFEVCIGVPDLIEAIRYWSLFGFHIQRKAALSKAEAEALYGVASGATCVRLGHQSSDHGLIRLFQWSRPTGEGLQMTPFRANGSRWSAAEVAQVARPFAHAKYHEGPIISHAPDAVPAPQPSREPFRSAIGLALEMAMVQPLARQVLFERADFPSPLYGCVNHGSFFQASQFTHCCIMLHGVPDSAFSFYDDVLGLKRSGDFDLPHDEIGTSGKDIFELEAGEGFHMVRFDDPRSGDGKEKRSGRLILFNFAAGSELPDVTQQTRLGCLGHTAYTWRVRDVHVLHGEAERAGAQYVGPILDNEFGEPSFSCDAPDGTQWVFIQASEAAVLAL
jgi:catechol 2,3-dioxygenase-like lactoylglutathione lyase family enzyme